MILIGLVVLFVFNPDAKVWLLRQTMATGLFNAEIDKEAPVLDPVTFSFRDERGNIVSTEALKGKVVFINFWATWCPPCRAEMPSLNNVYNQFQGDENIVFLFLNEDGDLAKANLYLQKNEFAMPLVTSVGNVPDKIYSGTLPTTLIINKEGSIVYKHEGMAKYNTNTFINQLKALR